MKLLDVIYNERIAFSKSENNYYIEHGLIRVNDVVIKNPEHEINVGDIISVGEKEIYKRFKVK